MLQDVVRNISFPERGLRSVGLQRVSQTHSALHAFTAFALGLVIGAGLALLLTPMSGPEMRKRVQEGIDGDEDALPAH